MEVLLCYDCPELCSVRNLLAKVTDSLPGGNCINQVLAIYIPCGFCLEVGKQWCKTVGQWQCGKGFSLRSIRSLLKIPGLGMGFGPCAFIESFNVF